LFVWDDFTRKSVQLEADPSLHLDGCGDACLISCLFE
jgi:hypothetical protein